MRNSRVRRLTTILPALLRISSRRHYPAEVEKPLTELFSDMFRDLSTNDEVLSDKENEEFDRALVRWRELLLQMPNCVKYAALNGRAEGNVIVDPPRPRGVIQILAAKPPKTEVVFR